MGEEDMINIENPKVNEVIQGIHETLLRKVKKAHRQRILL